MVVKDSRAPKIKFLGNIFLKSLELFFLSNVLLITGATQMEKYTM